jgi:hypothetical protein
MKKITLFLILLFISIAGNAEQTKQTVSSTTLKKVSNVLDSVYFMSFFKGSAQKLHYAYSYDAKTWVDINNSNPVFNAYDDGIWLRDPYLKKVTINGVTKYHLVHTWGWNNPTIFHWESTDLIHWTAANGLKTAAAGKIPVMDGKNGNGTSINAWAPEFSYDAASATFYVYWASDNGTGYLQHYYCTTKDWITFTPSALYFDPGFTTIDMTILKKDGTYYAYYKDERTGQKKIRVATSTSLNPAVQRFSGTTEVMPTYTTPAEGPEIFKSIGENKWNLYWDKFDGDLGLSYATSPDPTVLAGWTVVSDNQVINPTKAKHGSVEIISKAELTAILNFYNSTETIVLPTATVAAQSWKFTTTAPATNWYSTGFVDTGWSTANGGFGSAGTPGATVGTAWTSADIWLRKTFTAKALTADEINKLTIKIFYDEGAEVYINGILALTVTGYVTSYVTNDINAAAKSAFVSNGANTIAVHCHQTWGGQFIDVGLQTLTLSTTDNSELLLKPLNIYPSPAENTLYLSSSFDLNGSKIIISDLLGKQVSNCKGTDRIDISGLKSGMYVLILTASDNRKYSKKFLKK